MEMLLGRLGWAAYIGWLVCLLIVLVRLFHREGPLKGLLGLFCFIYAFVWGWMNADGPLIRGTMFIWSALVLVILVTSVVGGGMAALGQ